MSIHRPRARGHARRGRPAGVRHHLLPLAAACARPCRRPLARRCGPAPGPTVSTLAAALRAGPIGARGRRREGFLLLRGGGRLVACAQVAGRATSTACSPARRPTPPCWRPDSAARAGRGAWPHTEPTCSRSPGPASQPRSRSARFVTVSSDFGRSQLMLLVGKEHWPKIRVVHCGLDMAEYDGTPPTSTDRGDLCLITVGRLEHEKGHTLLLDALAAVRDQAGEPRP